ncbi:hypothetical protein [Aliiruegeria haliotis]|nr:hypothetical protein [Aliiruegeria haliotis]
MDRQRFSVLAGVLGALMATTSTAQDRTPIEDFIQNGFPLELAQEALSADLPHLLSGGDTAVYFNFDASEFLPTAVLPRRVPTMALGEHPMPETGGIKVET